MNEGATLKNNSNQAYSYMSSSVDVEGGTFYMTGGEISGNTTEFYGGGVSVRGKGNFTLSGGTISGNNAKYGGGVYVERGSFTKTGGIIYGSTIYGSDDTANKNTASSNNGHAVYLYIDSATTKKRNSTADEAVNIDSTLTGTAGGWE